ncbi:multidrug resistance protein MdtN [Rosistilla carotiformis]|uniref:Multidrug resistance protein MdtN n=1 Tax=Rosistilla carotiformis TaxID=2528017 RepID=A0A518K1J5_9BACT|nr:HlyD family efflux transporter periplasmic adaptor subunit [Rosistilla carotiformis]QDV71642.1 multidrug resistance protein MdtN [Rosistilla carotiformis]
MSDLIKPIFPLHVLFTIALFGGSICRGQDRSQPTSIETDCLLMILDQVDLAAERDGLLTTLHARTGEDVAAGQLLFQLRDVESKARLEVAKAELDQATVKAENHWNIRAAEIELAKNTKETELLDEVGRTPYLERYRAASNKDRSAAELKIAEAAQREESYARQVAEAELSVAEIDLKERESVSPFAGTIVKQFRFQSEWCRQGDPVVRILRMDRLTVQAIVNLRDIAPHQIIGMKAAATFQIAGEKPIVMDNLTITRCSPEVDLDGNYLVWTVTDNRKLPAANGQPQWLLRPGISGSLKIARAANILARNASE